MDVSDIYSDPLILCDLQTLVKNYNSYLKDFKNCSQRLKEISSEVATVLKQYDLIWITKNMYNKLTSTKLVAIIILNKDGDSLKLLLYNIMFQSTSKDSFTSFNGTPII